MSRRILFSVVRDEAPFLLEWVAYHRLIGFDTMVIYSNRCSDETDALLAALHERGIVVHRRHDPGEGAAQADAANRFHASGFLAPGDWVMWLDADEFLNIHSGAGLLPDLIAHIGGFQGMPVPWRVFGDSGMRRHPGRQVAPAFSRAEPASRPGVRMVKTLFRVGRGFRQMRIHAPLFAPDFWREGPGFMGSDGQAMTGDDPAVAAWAAGGALHLQARDTAYGIAQVNHYRVRTRAAFALKYRRGCGGQWGRSREAARQAYVMDNYDRLNANAARDISILRHEEALGRAMARLAATGPVGAIHARAWDSFRAHERRFLAAAASGPA